MKTTLRIRLAFAALAVLLSACASSPRVDRQLGDTVRAAMAAQVANPAAASNTDPVTGIDGRAARAAQDNYERSFKGPEEQTGVLPSIVGTK